VNAIITDRASLALGHVVHATIIDAPSSTKNKSKGRDPEMSSTKRATTVFLAEAHIGVDADSG